TRGDAGWPAGDHVQCGGMSTAPAQLIAVLPGTRQVFPDLSQFAQTPESPGLVALLFPSGTRTAGVSSCIFWNCVSAYRFVPCTVAVKVCQVPFVFPGLNSPPTLPPPPPHPPHLIPAPP